MDSESEILTLPEQIYKEGDESISMGTVLQHSDWSLDKKVEDVLGESLFEKIISYFLGPLVDLGPRIKAKRGTKNESN
ncbi:hypothetical protein AXX17_AT2G09700 [Arabidopsis thaliana]|uniref:Uncharacterized protein n=1 Tax=Arabidopsis thaliana TaxID=3702 RepID=A0A178VVD9_ARATH|nr:hypothetical protein AXX17_AT2G09700 [Arabidopsis thaliana]